MHVRLEGDDLDVLLQHLIGVELLVGGVRLHVHVNRIGQIEPRLRVERLVVLGKELEGEFQMRLGLPAVGMQMRRCEIQNRIRLQQSARVR